MVAASPAQWVLGIFLIASSLGMILSPKPVYSCVAFLLTLLSLAALFLQLSAQFIAVMQILIYAGAILVLFMFVIVLFQDAHRQIQKFPAKCSLWLLLGASISFIAILGLLSFRLKGLAAEEGLPQNFGTVQALGELLYIDFFFPFEAVIVLFLIAVIGTLYTGKKGEV